MPTDPARVKRTDPGDPEKARVGNCIRSIRRAAQAWVQEGVPQRRHRLCLEASSRSSTACSLSEADARTRERYLDDRLW